MPDAIEPMIATVPRDIPEGEEWATELLWDGVRAAAHCRDGSMVLQGADGRDVTDLFPELEGIGKVPRAQGTILDGAIVSFDERGMPRIDEIKRRTRPPPGRPTESFRSYIATMVIFDLLWDRGTDMRDRPYRERRAVLEHMGLSGPTWRVPGYLTGEVGATAAAAADQGLPGLVIKRLDSPYISGRGGEGDWLAVRHRALHEVVVGGIHRPVPGHRDGGLLVGFWERRGSGSLEFIYAGFVELGLSRDELGSLEADLRGFRRTGPPFALPEGMAGDDSIDFLNPRRVIAIEFERWDEHGLLSRPVYRSMRPDREPGDVRRPGA